MLVTSKHTRGEGATSMSWTWDDTEPIATIEDLAADTLLDFIARLAETRDDEGCFSSEITRLSTRTCLKRDGALPASRYKAISTS